MAAPVYIMGFMGSGKSTVGKKLASILERNFVDLDAEIEKQKGKKVASIFDQKGEAYFRKLEQNILYQLNTKNSVISVGGGTPCFFDNLSFMKSHGTTIYLHLSEDALFQRLKSAKTQRPLIAGLEEEELKTFINQKLKEREAYYQQAELVVSGINLKGPNLIDLANRIKSLT